MILSQQQVNIVREKIKKCDVDSVGTFNDLLDHICCMIEEKMKSGTSFEEALTLTMEQFPYKEIEQVNSSTLKLLNMEIIFSKRIITVSAIPFLLFGLAWIFSSSTLQIPEVIKGNMWYLFFLSMFLLFGIGWHKGFPRWTFPSIGFVLIISFFFMMVKIPWLSDHLLGLWAWLPLSITIGICLIIRPSVKPLQQLVNKVLKEPEMLLFTLYGIMPMIILMVCDEIYSPLITVFALFISAILLTGFFIFLSSRNKKIRISGIILSSVIAITASLLFCFSYWK